MKRIIVILSVAVLSMALLTSAKPKSPTRRVVYETTIDCDACVRKVTENVSFEKGVKDLKADLSDRCVTIDYNPEKTDTLKLATALRKLGYEAKVIEDKSL